VGSGARALGQSAFIAVADDATAASWNPAGLINLERPEASLVGMWTTTTADKSATDARVSFDPSSWSESEINFMSYAYPLELGNTDMVASINYHQVYSFGVEFNSVEFGRSLRGVPRQVVTDGRATGAVSAYSLASGISIPSYPQLTFGASVNWYTQSLLNDYAWQSKATEVATTFHPSPRPPQKQTSIDIEKFNDFRAHNFTFGLLWDMYQEGENLLTLGLVFHTPFTAEVDRKLISIVDGAYEPPIRDSMDIDLPRSFGAGVNYRLRDEFSMAFDVEWKEWSKFKYDYADGQSTSPVDDNTLAYRFGCEQLAFPKSTETSVYALRSGIFYEPRPVLGDIAPIYGLSVGLGWTLREKFSLDFAYQFRWGEQDFKYFDYRIDEHLLVTSWIVYF
jgi:long-subunit fatty acid transport protein